MLPPMNRNRIASRKAAELFVQSASSDIWCLIGMVSGSIVAGAVIGLLIVAIW